MRSATSLGEAVSPAGEPPSSAKRRRAGEELRFELVLALRLLRSARRDAQVNLLAVVAALGLALGVMALVIALAALSGFQSLLIHDARSSSPELQVVARSREDVGRWQARAAGTQGVASQQILLQGRCWLMVGGDARPVTLVGYEKSLPPWLAPSSAGRSGPQRELTDVQEAQGVGLWLPERLGRAWSLPPGSWVDLVSPRPTLSPAGPIPRRKSFMVAGWHENPIEEAAEERVALELETAAALLGDADWRLDIVALPNTQLSALRDRLEEGATASGLDGEVLTWRDLNRGLLFVLRLEKSAVFLGVVLIVLVASFALAAVVSILVAVKLRDFGLLSAIGLGPARLRRTLLVLGGLLGASGGILGAIVGLVTAVVADRLELLRLPGDVYVIDHVPFLVRGGDVAVVILATVVVTFAAAEFASRKARWIEPRVALQR